jgi:hypothetical protein
MKYINAKNPVWFNQDRNAIFLEVEFDNPQLPGYIPFVADINDPEPHGKELFQLAVDGSFGPIKVFQP